MRAHTKKHKDAKFIEAYIFRDGAQLIGSTVIIEGRHDLRQQFERLGRNGGFLHITLSLPEGLRAEKDDWIRIVMTQLELMGLPPLKLPWVAARHVDANCDHIHIALAPTTFLGEPLKPVLTRAQTDRNHQTMAKLLDLPVPEYFDPGFPTLRPPTPKRKLKSRKAICLHKALGEIFATDPPVSLEALSNRLQDRTEPIALIDINNCHGKPSYLFKTPYGDLPGGALGIAWEPRHLRARIELAMALAVARITLALKPIQAKLKDLSNAARAEITASENALQYPLEPVEIDRRKDRSPVAPAGTPQTDEDGKLGAGETTSGSALVAERGTAPEPGAPAQAGGRPEGELRSAEESNGKIGRDRRETGQTAENHEHPDGLMFGAWLARTLALLSANVRRWRWQRLPDQLAISVDFPAGDRAIISAQGVRVIQDGPDATRLSSLYEARDTPNTDESETSLPAPSPYDDGPGL
ncbi:hypothetical protein [uncultured Thioclava sp.]|uniref:relaxase/mobilization nuclease domain-containing protein n=1 Tax=uncultured Thioclava sp. TaxID=473858 RepID=UPI0025E0132D|nr:hypothetical protein [uncultured Thioclava sp.]